MAHPIFPRAASIRIVAIVLGLQTLLLLPPGGAAEFAGPEPVGFRMIRQPSAKVRCRLQRSASFPQMAVSEYSLTIAIPPDHDGQEVVETTLSRGFERVKDLQDSSRELAQKFERIAKPRVPTRIDCEADMTFQLFERKLRKVGRSDRRRDDPNTLDAATVARFLRSDETYDFDSSEFQQWKRQRTLYPTSRQTEIEFAEAVFDRIAADYRYGFDFKQKRVASNLCRTRETDCGGLSILFVATMRSEGIPSRSLVGHYAESLSAGQRGREEPEGKRHVIAEFYARGVGWVPIDLASAILAPTARLGKSHFGSQSKPFATLHFDHQVRFDTRVWGEKTENFLQFPRLWFRGRGPFKNRKISDGWDVRVLKQSTGSSAQSDKSKWSSLPPVHVPVPHVTQAKQLCAPASAEMILKTFGVQISQNRIKELANNARQVNGTDAAFTGTFFVDLVKGLEDGGVANWRQRHFPSDDQGFESGIMEIYRNLERGLPVMVDTYVPPSGHTVVVNGIDLRRGLVLIVDPNVASPGIRRLTINQFRSMWRSVTVDRRGVIMSERPNN
ncbi:MAG: C39 family peptidase [Planctomycetota bacterium]